MSEKPRYKMIDQIRFLRKATLWYMYMYVDTYECLSFRLFGITLNVSRFQLQQYRFEKSCIIRYYQIFKLFESLKTWSFVIMSRNSFSISFFKLQTVTHNVKYNQKFSYFEKFRGMRWSFEAKSDLYLKILDVQEVSLVISVSLFLSLRTFCQRVQFNFCSTTDKFTGYMDERQRRKVESKRKRVSLSSSRARNKERTMEFRYCANR